MFKGFMNRMYMGNPNRPDYNPEDMPDNRWKLFVTVLGVRGWGLVTISLLLSVFLIPTLLWTMLNLAVLSQGQGEDLQMVAQTLQMYLLGLIPCLVILSPGVAGATYVLRNWARDQHAAAWSDFLDGIKENWKQALGVGLINGIVINLLYFNAQTYGQIVEGLLGAVLSVMMWVMALLLALANIFIYPLMVTYALKFRQLWRNALLLTMARLPQTVGFFLLAVVPFLVVAFFIPNVTVFAVAFYLLFGLGFFGLMFNSFTNGVFDKYINPNIEGAVVGRGLRQEEEDDEDDEGEDEEE